MGRFTLILSSCKLSSCKGHLRRLMQSYTHRAEGAVSIEFVLCSLFFIPLFLGLTDLARANTVKRQVADTGESVLRAMTHVPEYDLKMREAIDLFCDLDRNSRDNYDIQIVSGAYTSMTYKIDWEHYPCGTVSPGYKSITVSELNSKLGSLSLRENESFVSVKIIHVANSLEQSKFLYAPEGHTFEYFDAAIPRIGKTLQFSNADLYDIDSYEY